MGALKGGLMLGTVSGSSWGCVVTVSLIHSMGVWTLFGAFQGYLSTIWHISGVPRLGSSAAALLHGGR